MRKGTGVAVLISMVFLAWSAAFAELPDGIENFVRESGLSPEKKEALLEVAISAVRYRVPQAHVEIIIRRGISRDWDAEALIRSLEMAESAVRAGLPVRPVLDRMEQGLAKGIAPGMVLDSTERLLEKLGEADSLLERIEGIGSANNEEWENAVETTAWALAKGVPQQVIMDMGAEAARRGGSLELFGSAVGATAVFAEIGIPMERASGLVIKALEKGYSERDIAHMEREVAMHYKEGVPLEDVIRRTDSILEGERFGPQGPAQGGGSIGGGGFTPPAGPGGGISIPGGR